jgi:hypothetical protein
MTDFQADNLITLVKLNNSMQMPHTPHVQHNVCFD